MGKSLVTSKQIAIVNYKMEVNSASGIEALYMLTPFTDGVAGLKIAGRIRPDVNRLDLMGADYLTPRGITETAAQAKFMPTMAAVKTFFGLVNNGDTAAALGMPWIKLDAGGVFWDPTVSAFPEQAIFTTSATEGVTSDSANTHKFLNYFNPVTGDFGVAPVKAAADSTTTPQTFVQKYKNTLIWGGVAAGVAALAYFLWPRKKAKVYLPKRRK